MQKQRNRHCNHPQVPWRRSLEADPDTACRAVTAGDKFRCVELLDVKGERGSKPGEARKLGGGFSNTKTLGIENHNAERTAKLVGISNVQVNKIRTILAYCRT